MQDFWDCWMVEGSMKRPCLIETVVSERCHSGKIRNSRFAPALGFATVRDSQQPSNVTIVSECKVLTIKGRLPELPESNLACFFFFWI
jgi:hypothetical protein